MKKTKSIQIDQELHEKIKQYCVERDLKLQKFIEKLIKYELSKSVQSNSDESQVRS